VRPQKAQRPQLQLNALFDQSEGLLRSKGRADKQTTPTGYGLPEVKTTSAEAKDLIERVVEMAVSEPRSTGSRVLPPSVGFV